MTEDFEPENRDRLDSRLGEDEELEELLGAWQAERPSIDLAQRLLHSYRSRRSFLAGALFGRTVRVPVWAAAACMVLFLAMLPLAIRGLTLDGREGRTLHAPRSNSFTPRGGTELGSISTKSSIATEHYVTIADLTTLEPTKSVNLTVFRAGEKEQ